MTTRTVATGTMTTINAALPTPPVASMLKASFTDILSERVSSVRASILNSFMSSLNLQLIAQCRRHVQFGDRSAAVITRGRDAEVPTIDMANELMQDEDVRRFDKYFGNISGQNVELDPIETAQLLGFIRKYVLDIQRTDNIARPSWEPRALSESVEFLVSQLPTEVSVTEPHIKVLAATMRKPVEMVAKMASAANTQELDRLLNDVPDILSLAEKLSEGDDFADEGHLAEAVERALSSLPPITQINLFTSACNAITTAYNAAFKRVLRGRASEAGDMVVCEELLRRATLQRDTLLKQYASEIYEYEDRGGEIKALKTIG